MASESGPLEVAIKRFRLYVASHPDTDCSKTIGYAIDMLLGYLESVIERETLLERMWIENVIDCNDCEIAEQDLEDLRALHEGVDENADITNDKDLKTLHEGVDEHADIRSRLGEICEVLISIIERLAKRAAQYYDIHVKDMDAFRSLKEVEKDQPKEEKPRRPSQETGLSREDAMLNGIQDSIGEFIIIQRTFCGLRTTIEEERIFWNAKLGEDLSEFRQLGGLLESGLMILRGMRKKLDELGEEFERVLEAEKPFWKRGWTGRLYRVMLETWYGHPVHPRWL